MKRFRTWDEIVLEGSTPATPEGQALMIEDKAATAATQEPVAAAESEEEGALPEEGELAEP